MSDHEKRDSRWDIMPNLLALDQIAREHRSLKNFGASGPPQVRSQGGQWGLAPAKKSECPAGFGTVGLTHSDPVGE